MQITAVARRRIQILVATLKQRRFMMRAEMRDLFKVGPNYCTGSPEPGVPMGSGANTRVIHATVVFMGVCCMDISLHVQDTDSNYSDHGRMDNKSLLRLISWGEEAGVLKVCSLPLACTPHMWPCTWTFIGRFLGHPPV